jgi:hypothetical protein
VCDFHPHIHLDLRFLRNSLQYCKFMVKNNNEANFYAGFLDISLRFSCLCDYQSEKICTIIQRCFSLTAFFLLNIIVTLLYDGLTQPFQVLNLPRGNDNSNETLWPLIYKDKKNRVCCNENETVLYRKHKTSSIKTNYIGYF